MSTTPSNLPDLSASKWTRLADLPQARFGSAVVAVDENRLVAVGGGVQKNRNSRHEVTASGAVYDIRTNQWTPLKNDMPTPREQCKAVCIDKKVYVLGGMNRNNSYGFDKVDNVEMLDLETKEWTELASMRETGIFCHAVAVGRWIYIVRHRYNPATASVWQVGQRFNVDTGDWDTYRRWPRFKSGLDCLAVAVGTKIYVIFEDGSSFTTMDVFDTVTESWETPGRSSGTRVVYPRWASAVPLADRYIVVTGGKDHGLNTLGTVATYDTQTNQWSQLPVEGMNEPRYQHERVVLGKSRVVVMGGRDATDVILNSVEQLNLWQLLLPPPIPRTQQLFGDGTKGDDLLGVEEVARALADIIALKDLKPPFVAGILGQWGSGKSFFVELVMRRLEEITEYNLTDPQVEANSPYVGHIYVVHFDVWTFGKGNLWASMTYQVLMELNKQLNLESKLREDGPQLLLKGVSVLLLMEQLSKGELEYLERLLDKEKDKSLLDKEKDKSLKEMLSSMSLNRTTATQALVDALDLHYESDQKKLQRLKRELAWAIVSESPTNRSFHERLCSFLSFFGVKTGNAISIENMDPQELKESLHSLNCLLPCLAQGLAQVVGWSPLSTAIAIVVALVLFFIPDILELVGLTDDVDRLFSWIGLAAPVVVGIWIQVQNTQQKWAKLETAFKGAREREADLERGERLPPRDQTASLNNGIERRPLAAIQSEIVELENHLWIVEGESIDEAVRRRLESNDYGDHLGIVHKAQEDLERLSQAFLNRREKAKEIFPRGKPRIVLVIDDLDRCPPEKVVETLEAAQLLVKTELFVVIMCLDARYATLALEKKYEGVLFRDKHPTGLDYLEKIIQLPYRLPPINTSDAMDRYVESQMGSIKKRAKGTPHATKQPESSFSQPVVQPPIDPDSYSTDEVSPQADEPAFTAVEESKEEVSPESSDTAEPTSSAQSPEKRPENQGSRQAIPHTMALEFDEEEHKLVSKVCLSAGLSPRSTKRMVNVFKILKLIWRSQDDRLTTTAGPSDDAEWHRNARDACLLLLAMSASPDKELHFAMGSLFKSIDRSRSIKTADSLKDFVLNTIALDAANSSEFLEPCLAVVDELLGRVSLSSDARRADILHYLRIVRSFSFVEPCSSQDV